MHFFHMALNISIIAAMRSFQYILYNISNLGQRSKQLLFPRCSFVFPVYKSPFLAVAAVHLAQQILLARRPCSYPFNVQRGPITLFVSELLIFVCIILHIELQHAIN